MKGAERSIRCPSILMAGRTAMGTRRGRVIANDDAPGRSRGQYHSSAIQTLHAARSESIQYDATIDDPETFTKPDDLDAASAIANAELPSTSASSSENLLWRRMKAPK
jgi:hypothetical protein